MVNHNALKVVWWSLLDLGYPGFKELWCSRTNLLQGSLWRDTASEFTYYARSDR